MNKESPTKAELLGQLDFEISRLSDADKQSGLTLWTLWAALAGSLWLLTRELDSPQQPYGLSLLAFLLLVVMHTIYHSLREMLSPAETAQECKGRVRQTTALRWGRFMYLVSACKGLLIVIVSIYVARHFSFGTAWLLVLHFASMSAMTVGVIVISYTAFPIPKASQPMRRVVNTLGALPLIVLLVGISQPLIAVIRGNPVLPMSAWRIGGLFFVVSLLLEWIVVQETAVSWIVGALLGLRHDLVLHHASPHHIKEQFTQMVAGVTVSQILRPDFEMIQGLGQRVTADFHALTKACASLKEASPDRKAAIRGQMALDLSAAESAMAKLASLVSRFVRRATWLEVVSSDCSPESRELAESVLAKAENAKKEYELARSQADSEGTPETSQNVNSGDS